MDGRDSFLCTATVATSAAVLKLITGGNLFSPADPSAYITFSLHRVGRAERSKEKLEYKFGDIYRMSCKQLGALDSQNNVQERRSTREEKRGKERLKEKRQEREDLSCTPTLQTQGLCCSFNARLGRLS